MKTLTLPGATTFSLPRLCAAASMPLHATAHMPPGLVDELAAHHAAFAARMTALRLSTAQGGYAAVWLDVEVEQAIDAAWGHNAERAFWLHAVAQDVCMQAVCRLVPEAAAHGCAPVPLPDPELPAALRRAGLACHDATPPSPARRYAVVTADPFMGGCESCALCAACPGRPVSWHEID